MKAESDAEERGPEKESGKGAQARVTEGPSGSSQPLIELDFVRGLIEAVDNSGIDSLEITRAGTRVKISKTPPATLTSPAYAPSMYGPPPAPAAPAPAAPPAPTSQAAETGAGGAAGAPKVDESLTEVKSPMVGTFYRAPAPEAPPYVEVGSRVSKGQTLCILEAMKLMNELESEVEGVIREILIDNAEPVEYGQVLFRIDPNG